MASKGDLETYAGDTVEQVTARVNGPAAGAASNANSHSTESDNHDHLVISDDPEHVREPGRATGST